VVITLEAYFRLFCAWYYSWWAWLDDLRWIWRICAYWLGNKVDTQIFRVSCVCGTVGLVRSIGLRKIGQRQKGLRLGKEILYNFLWFTQTMCGILLSISN